MNALCLLGGVLLALWTPAALQPPAWMLCPLAPLLLFRSCRRATIIVVAGFLYAQYSAGKVLDAPHDCDERRLVEAQVQTIPAATDSGWQFDALVWTPERSGGAGLRVRLDFPAPIPPRAGEKWQLLVQFAAADGPGREAQRRNLLRDRISARARVRDSPLNRRLAESPWSIDVLRERVAKRIVQRVPDPAAAGLLAALAVGVTGDVSTSQWRVFNATGITHLVAISGMHVTFFAMLCMSLARFVWRRWPGATVPLRRESFAASVGVLLAFAYALLSGFSVPAQRTAVMLAAFLILRCCGRTGSPSWSVGAAIIAVLLFDPLAALSSGFWLSFCAVAAIIFLAGGRLMVPVSWRAAVHVQWVVTVALLPFTILLFGSFSLLGPLVNAIAIPVFTFALVPPLLVATALYLCPGAIPGIIADRLIDLTGWVAATGWPSLAHSADWKLALIGAEPGLWWFCLALPAAAAVLLPLPRALRLVAAGLVCSAFLSRSARPAAGELEITALDVGASRAVLLRTARHQLLLGSGESFGGGGRRFESQVLPELLRGGYRRLDLLVLDRADRDSLQAVLRAAARLRLRGVITGDTGRLTPELAPCVARHWQWDGVEFSQHPQQRGCWVSARAGTHTFLAAPERLEGAPADHEVQVLLMPRAARDAAALLSQVTPSAVILASLSGNDWHSDAWRRLRAQPDAAAVLATAAEGSLRVMLRPQSPPDVHRLMRSLPGIWSRPPSASCRHVEGVTEPRPGRMQRVDSAMMPAHVGNRAGRRPVHVADHPVLHHLWSNRP